MEPIDVQETIKTKTKHDEEKDDEEEDDFIEDVTPRVNKTDMPTVHFVPAGLTFDDPHEPSRPLEHDSRWTMRKSFTDVPITHRSLSDSTKRAQRFALQGDSGANCTATDREESLWNVKCFATPLPVKTFDGESNEAGEHRTVAAIGAGILKMVDDNNHIMNCHCSLIPHSTGTVISLDKFMRDNRSIVRFQQEGTTFEIL
jgi:hypothetical protein